MITERNEFFNPDDYDHEVLGFLEELVEVETNKHLGFRRLEGLPQRPIGSQGRIQFTLTENVIVSRGHKTGIVIKASPKRPLRVEGMLLSIGGRSRTK